MILLTGANGQVGWELRRTLAPLGPVLALGHEDLDLADPTAIRATIRRTAPDVVVNAAAYTAVDRAETERDEAYAINALAPRVIAEEAASLGAPLVHYSTDYVFDGTKRTPYTEDDPVAPLGAYGASKAAGDAAVASTAAQHIILRTSWVYAARGHNFLLTILRLAHERQELRVVADQLGAPTPARLVAQVTAHVLGRCASGGRVEIPEAVRGTYNVVARGCASWYDFASAILALDPERETQTVRGVIPIPTTQYPTPARRPAHSVLDPTKLEHAFGCQMPEWREQLALVMDARASRAGATPAPRLPVAS